MNILQLPQVDKWQKKLKDEQSSGIFSKNGSIDQLVNILLGKENVSELRVCETRDDE